MHDKRIMLANRFFEADPAKRENSLARLNAFVRQMQQLQIFETIAVAVNVDSDMSDAIGFLRATFPLEVKAIPVTPWGKFVPALSALVSQAVADKVDYVFFASTEVAVHDRQAILALAQHMDDNTFVAGPRLDGHSFSLGIRQCEGDTVPWNTAAMWRVKDGLDRLGFPSVGEAYFDDTLAGIEEFGAIAVYQSLYTDCGAKLIEMDGIVWAKENGSEPGKVTAKLATKKSRAKAQCDHSKLSPGKVKQL